MKYFYLLSGQVPHLRQSGGFITRPWWEVRARPSYCWRVPSHCRRSGQSWCWPTWPTPGPASTHVSLSICLSSSTHLLHVGVAINNAGVAAASTNLTVVHLSFIYRFSWEFWFLVLLTFILVFFIFVGLICKTMCRHVATQEDDDLLITLLLARARHLQQNEKEETKTEVEFQYAETFLRWGYCNDCRPQLQQTI